MVWAALAALGLGGCAGPSEPTELHGQVRLTLLHMPDLHSRLFPYSLQIGHIDSQLGLGEVDTIANVGGAARISHIVGRERARAGRSLFLDTGDPFQGAPVFNYFGGEAEFRVMSAMGLDAMTVGNHEFDKGPVNLAKQTQKFAEFPALVANYMFEDPAQPGASPLGAVTQPFQVYDLEGLKVAVIGMGTLRSITSIYDLPNSLGIIPLATIETLQSYVDLLRPIVDLVVVASHMGFHSDQEFIEATSGIDVVVGGHNHIVLQPPKRVRDCARVDAQGRHYIEINSPDPQDPDEPSVKRRRYCQPRDVVLSHSGAFAKYVGRLDLVVSNELADFEAGYRLDPIDRFEVLSYDYHLFPVNEQVPDDPVVSMVLERYGRGLERLTDLDLLVGYCPEGSRRFAANGGDSPLGNLIATAMWLRLGIQTDFSLTNTTGIRADVVPGPVSVEQMFNIFPFDNSITKMQLSGLEVRELFDYVARRSAGRGCKSQVQIAGARIVFDCVAQSDDPNLPPGVATHIYIGTYPDKTCLSDSDCPGAVPNSCDVPPGATKGVCWLLIDDLASYEMATSNYLAGGGSGYRMLQRNTTQKDTGIQQRDALIDFIRGGKPCGAQSDGSLVPCRQDGDCHAALGDEYVCACPDATIEGPVCETHPDKRCAWQDEPGPEDGACVLARCRDDVAAFELEMCERAPTEEIRLECLAARTPCATAGEMCKFLTCIDRDMGNYSDGRAMMVGK